MKVIEPIVGEEEIEEVTKALLTGRLSQGEYVERFEEAIAEYLGVPQEKVVAVSSGTAALHLALVVLMPITSVSIPATTFVSSGNVINFVELEAVFVDVDPDTWNAPDYTTIGVDLFGNPITYKPLIEDAAEALGSSYKGRKCGTFGRISCLSFFENKIITTAGEGGALVCETLDDAIIARLLRQQGKNYTMLYPELMGFNYRMTEIQAAFGLAQMERLDSLVQRKREIFELYKENCPDLQFQREVGYSNRWLTAVLLEAREKLKLRKAFDRWEIPWRHLFPPLYLHDWFQDPDELLLVSERLWMGGLALPSSPQMSDEYILGVCKVINRCLK